MSSSGFHLDPTQRVVNVHWNSALIGVLEFDIDWQGYQDYSDDPTLHDMPFGTTYSLLSQDQTFVPLDLKTDTWPPQITADMLGKGDLWSYAAYYENLDTTQTITTTIIDQERYYYWPYSQPFGTHYSATFTYTNADTVPVWGGPFSTPYECAAHYFYYQAQAYAGAPPGLGPGQIFSFNDVYPTLTDTYLITHQGQVQQTTYHKKRRAVFFLNISEIKKLITLDTFSIQISTGATTSSTQQYNWNAKLSTFKNKTLFPVDSQNLPTWNYTPESSLTISGVNDAEIGLPAYTTTFDIDVKTLLVSGNKV